MLIKAAVKNAIHRSLRMVGIDIIRFQNPEQRFPSDFRDDEIRIIRDVAPWTKTSPERLYALIQAVRYVSANGISGAVVECGVWKGGSMAAVAKTLLELHHVERDLYLFDTFRGMSGPTSKDVDYSGKPASELIVEDPGFQCADAPLQLVRTVLKSTGYPEERIHLVEGMVEETIPGSAPESISLLRLDTDWYESTRHELVHLFPRISPGGVIIIDDYGHWKGARQACDEYFDKNGTPVLLNRIDYTGRIALKPWMT